MSEDIYLNLLMEEFHQADVPLEKVALKYLNMSYERAKRFAALGQLPFPVYRPGSAKSSWLVRITDLADWLSVERVRAMNRTPEEEK